MNWRRALKIIVVGISTAIGIALGVFLESDSQQDHMVLVGTTVIFIAIGIALANHWFPVKQSSKNRRLPDLDSPRESLDMVLLRRSNSRRDCLIDDIDRPAYMRRKTNGITNWSLRWKKYTGRSFPRKYRAV